MILSLQEISVFPSILKIRNPFFWNFLQNFLEYQFVAMSKIQVSETSVANFVQKAFEIISVMIELTKNQEYVDIVEWSSNGKQFTIKDIEKFEEMILPKYFRHRNINSFIRQLNMYGFHKSRKEPTKNIFSHPFFQRDKKQMLINVKRKIKLDELQTPQKIKTPEPSQDKITHDAVKQTAQKEQPQQLQPQQSLCSIALIKSSNNIEKQQPVSPFKSFMISRSFILDINPDACLRLRQNNSFVAQEEDQQDDNLSIADQINRERQRFNNRTQGISIVKTSNFLEDFQF